MGATLAAQATLKWAHVSDKAFRVLVRMAVVAHDRASASAPERRYFGGHDGLVDVVGCREGTTTAVKLRRVREAIAELEQRGAIRTEQASQPGRNAVYELTLDAVPMAAKPRRKRPFKLKPVDETQAAPPPTSAAAPPPTKEAEPPPIAQAAPPPTSYIGRGAIEDSLEERFEDVPARSSDPPALRLVAGSAQPESRFIQPSIWPASVPTPRPPADPVRSLTPGEQARIDVRRLLADRKRGRASA